MLRVEERAENLKEGQKRIEATVNRTANILDAFLGRLDNLEINNKVSANQARIFGYKSMTMKKEYQDLNQPLLP